MICCGFCGGLIQFIEAPDVFDMTIFKCVKCGAVNPPLTNDGDDKIIEEDIGDA